jgi:hypothetical protein
VDIPPYFFISAVPQDDAIYATFPARIFARTSRTLNEFALPYTSSFLQLTNISQANVAAICMEIVAFFL